MINKCPLFCQQVFEGGAIIIITVLFSRTVVISIQIRVPIHFLESIASGSDLLETITLLQRLGLPLQYLDLLGLLDALLLNSLFKKRILFELLLYKILKLKTRQLKQLDCLLQLRSHYQLLSELHLLAHFNCHHSSPKKTLTCKSKACTCHRDRFPSLFCCLQSAPE